MATDRREEEITLPWPLAAKIVAAYAKLAYERLSPYGVTPVQWAILEACSRGREDTVTGLARVIPLDTASISRQVDGLVKKGLIQRRRQRRDRRVVRLELTEEGTGLMPELSLRLEEVDSILLGGVTAEENRVFIRTVGKILANFKGTQVLLKEVGAVKAASR